MDYNKRNKGPLCLIVVKLFKTIKKGKIKRDLLSVKDIMNNSVPNEIKRGKCRDLKV